MSDRGTTAAIDEELTGLLREIIDEFDCVAGTIHRAAGDALHLVAHVRIPESVLERTRTIPFGKGMAGIAAERAEPVEVCNLQTDDSGVAEDGARDTGMEGSIAVPIRGPEGSLEGVFGVAKPESYEFSDEERERLLDAGERIAREL